MKQKNLVFLVILAVGLILSSCFNDETKTLSDKWYEDTKAQILMQSDQKADSIEITFNKDSSFRYEHYYFGNQNFMLKGYSRDILRLETRFSKNKNFELRREICDNGNSGFEGIVYKKNFYGLSTWRDCSGKIAEQGVRYNDQKIGVWKTWDETGKLIKEEDYGNISKIDSMPTILRY